MRSFPALLLLLIGSLLIFVPSALCNAKFEELKKLRASSAVIQLSAAEFDRFTAGASRPYSLMVYFNAAKIKEASSLKLKENQQKFKAVAKAARSAAKRDASHSANKLFFVELDMEHSRDVFMRLGVSNLPWVTHIGPEQGKQPGGQWQIHADETMTPATYGRGVWALAAFNSFVQARAHVNLGPLAEPSALNDPLLLATLLLLLVPLAYTGWRVYTSSWIGSPWIWSTFVVLIFMFATSGGLYNIIRGVPLTRVTEATGTVEWFQGGQGQLGMEGLVVGGMYVLFALSCIGLLSVSDLTSDATTVRVVSVACMVAAVFFARQIVAFYRWKTGYHWRFYLLEWLAK